jgi:nucleoside-diphosphate-sugar epimerase
LKYLLTGGAGFIGSHLGEALTAEGHEVVVLDDLSTGRVENVAHLLAGGRAELVEGSVLDEEVVLELLGEVDGCLHLASIVGVSLVVGRPVETLLANVRGADVVLSAAARLGRPLLLTSTSEIYGKGDGSALRESSDRVWGATWKSRWNYATSKSFAEALALGYHRELGADNTIVRLFNTVGPRQRDAFGMVVPRFVRQALADEDITVFGDGSQTRCFAHVLDSVDAIVRMLRLGSTAGRVFNVGSGSPIAIRELAERVIARAGSNSGLRFVPYAEAYGEGFEELGRRQPDTTALYQHTGWQARRTIDETIDDVILFEQAAIAAAGRNGGVRVSG